MTMFVILVRLISNETSLSDFPKWFREIVIKQKCKKRELLSSKNSIEMFVITRYKHESEIIELITAHIFDRLELSWFSR